MFLHAPLTTCARTRVSNTYLTFQLHPAGHRSGSPEKTSKLKAKRTLVFTGLSFDTHPNNCGSGHGRIDIARAFAQVGCLLVMTCELVANQRRHRFANSLLDDPICLYSRGKELDALVFVRIVTFEETLKTSLER